jgi:hypothetical protein
VLGRLPRAQGRDMQAYRVNSYGGPASYGMSQLEGCRRWRRIAGIECCDDTCLVLEVSTPGRLEMDHGRRRTQVWSWGGLMGAAAFQQPGDWMETAGAWMPQRVPSLGLARLGTSRAGDGSCGTGWQGWELRTSASLRTCTSTCLFRATIACYLGMGCECIAS